MATAGNEEQTILQVKIKLPPRQDRAYVRPPQREQNFVPTRYHVE